MATMTTFDPQRPCGSKTRAKDRYTRPDLLRLCQHYNIPYTSKDTLDALCTLLKSHTTQQENPENQEDVILIPWASQTNTALKKTVTSSFSSLLASFKKKKTSLLPSISSIPSIPSSSHPPPLFDTSRPCNSISRAKNRYTRKELEALLHQHNISIHPKDTMIHLCHKAAGLLKNSPSVKILPVVHKTHFPTSTKGKLSMDVTNTPCLAPLRRPCVVSKSYPLWKKEDMERFWITHACASVYQGKHPRTKSDYCKAFSSIVQHKITKNMSTLPVHIKTSLENWLKKRSLSKRKKFSYNTNLKSTYVWNIPYSSLATHKKVVEQFPVLESSANPQVKKTLMYSFSCSPHRSYNGIKFLPVDKKLFHNTNYLFNRNTHQDFSQQFSKDIRRQEEYVFTQLNPHQRQVILSYTYGGDKIVNSFLLGTFDVFKIIPAISTDPSSAYKRYRNRYMMPLTFYLFHDLQQSRDASAFMKTVLQKNGKINGGVRNVKSLLQKCFQDYQHVKTLQESYLLLLDWFCHHRSVLNEKLGPWIKTYVEQYVRDLSSIIDKAPPLLYDLFVYRGITTKDYIRIGEKKKNVFVQQPFMSTSINLCNSVFFKSKTTPCCLHQIFVPKGTKVLFLFLLSYFDEQELLFSPETWLYPLRPEYQFPVEGGTLQVQDWSLVS